MNRERGTGRTTYQVKTAILDIKHKNRVLPIVVHCPSLSIFRHIADQILREAFGVVGGMTRKDIIWTGSPENFIGS